MHPVVFHRVLDLVDAAGWQVRQHDGRLEVLVAAQGPGFDPAATERAVHAALAGANAAPRPVRISIVDTIPAGRPETAAHRR